MLKAVICGLCVFDSKERLDGDVVWQWLSKYGKEIKARERFDVGSVVSERIDLCVQEMRWEILKLKSGKLSQNIYSSPHEPTQLEKSP